jgi:hypothetical protein
MEKVEILITCVLQTMYATSYDEHNFHGLPTLTTRWYRHIATSMYHI